MLYNVSIGPGSELGFCECAQLRCSGVEVPPHGSEAYAAPEVVRAMHERAPITAHSAEDIWALGVVAYEAIASTRVFSSVLDRGSAALCARGQRRYVWEVPGACSKAFMRSNMREVVLRCLSRHAADRPAAVTVLRAFSQLYVNPALPTPVKADAS